jgi:hypothetical protein
MVKKSSNPNKEYRSFTIEGSSIGFEGGKFISLSPGSAASKAGTKLFRLVKKDPEYKGKASDVIQFIIRETTQGSKSKTLAYDAKVVKLSPPVERIFPNPKYDSSKPEDESNQKYTVSLVTEKVKIKALKEHEVHSSLQERM